MKYWVYINDKVDGPYDENNLVAIEGFTPETLICSEEVASGGGQEWVKASSIFEFDEEPVAQPFVQAAAQPAAEQAVPNTQELLARLDALSNGMSSLQAKLDVMQSHLDQALEENKKLAQQGIPQAEVHTPIAAEEDPRANTITLTRHSISPDADAKETPSYPQQATPQEEELIIRSALDSMYGGKPTDAQELKELEEDTFHDLVTGETSADLAREEEEQAVEEIATQLHFTPVEEEQPAKEEPVVENAIITTPSVFEAEKDALINELTSSAKDDVLDQIIAEHQQEQTSSDGAALAAAGAVAGLAAAALAATPQKQEQPISIATDKNNPQQLEEVLPADQLPEDVLPPALNEEPAEQTPETPAADLPSVKQEPDVLPAAEPQEQPQEPTADLPVADTPQNLEQPQPETQAVQPDLPVADTPQNLPQEQSVEPEPTALPSVEQQPQPQPQVEQEPTESIVELVPAAAPAEQEEPTPAKQEEPAPAEKENPALAVAPQTHDVQEPVQPEQESAQSPQETAAGITEKDLQDAFGTKEEQAPQPAEQSAPVATVQTFLSEDIDAEGNPNELTEIELKEGSTYLISDFVPPAQVTDNVADIMQPTQQNAKKQETIFQDMLATSTIGQSATPLSTDGLPGDLSATQINLENTIQAKRGASFDIKTVPLVPDPTKTDRLDMNELQDVNAQHDLKTQGNAKSSKWIVRGLIVLFVLIVYVLLALLHLLPDSVNFLSGKKAETVSAQNAQALLQEDTEAAVEPAEPEEPVQPTPQELAQEKVQNFPLPNGYSLKGFIESKHATISPELITWEVADAVEPDNYSVTVKVPPENPQNFKTVYRFNYNMQTGLLDPTISDAKNLLDQAYGINPAQSVATAATAPAPKTTKRATTRRTTRKR